MSSHDPNKSLRWTLGGFAESTVWLIVGAFVFSIGYRKSGLGRRLALLLVRSLGRRTLGLGYAVAFADLMLAPATPSNTARSGGTIYPIVSNIPRIYGSEPGPTAGRIGTYVMWTAFAATAVTSSLFLTALAPNAAALTIAKKIAGRGHELVAMVHRLCAARRAAADCWCRCSATWSAGRRSRKARKSSTWSCERAQGDGAAVAQRVGDVGAGGAGDVPLDHRLESEHQACRCLGDPTSSTRPWWCFVVISLLLRHARRSSSATSFAEKSAWEVFFYFTSLLTLSSGLNEIGFIKWVAEGYAKELAGLGPTVGMILLVSFFFWIHYFFSSITSHAAAVLPVVLAVGSSIPGLSMPVLTLLCVYSLGLMGVISPYATGPAPMYYGSGYIGKGDFWKFGLIFGVIIAGLLLIVMPWLRVV